MVQNIDDHYNLKRKSVVLILSIVLLFGTISSVANTNLTGVPLSNFAYAAIDSSDNKGDESTGSEEDNKDSGDTNEKDTDQAKQEDSKENGDENSDDGDTSSDSNSQDLEQQNKCSNVLNEETGKCKETKNDDTNSEDQEESIDSSDPDLCLKITGQQARAQSQEELDSIIRPEQCLASKNKETESTEDNEQEESEIKETSSSSDSNSNNKKSDSNGDSDKSDSKTKIQSNECLEDSTLALAAIGEVIVKQCSDNKGKKVDGQSEGNLENQLLTQDEKDFEQGYSMAFGAVLSMMKVGGSGLDISLKRYVLAPSFENTALRMGFIFGLQAAIAQHDIMMEEAKLQKDTLEALGVQRAISAHDIMVEEAKLQNDTLEALGVKGLNQLLIPR